MSTRPVALSGATSFAPRRSRFAVAASALLFAGLSVAGPALSLGAGSGSVSLASLGIPYTQNFDTLALSGTSSTLPNGWFFDEAGSSAANNGLYTAGTGSGTAGDVYSFGAVASTERAFGGLLSGTLTPTLGASFTNNTGSTITNLAISYNGEQWRLGTLSRLDRLDFQLSTNATSVVTGTWTDYDSLDFTAPVTTGTIGALDGNAAANRTATSFTITGLVIPNGATFWIRWSDFNGSGADDGLAVDDFSLTPTLAESAPQVSSTTPANGAANVALTSNVSVTFSENVNVAGSWFTLSCATSGAHTAAVTGGPLTFTLNPVADFAAGELCTLTVLAAQVTDQDSNDPPDNMVADYVGTFTTVLPPISIHDIQGAAHLSPKVGQTVTTAASIVTGLRTNGFYMQEPSPDADDATSEGLFVFTGSAPTVNVGDSVQVTGLVTEFRQGGGASSNLTVTELGGSISVSTLSTGNPLPPPVVIGVGGRIPPTSVIEDDASGSVETGAIFDPASDGIDFWESLEAMRVQVNNAVVVGPTSDFGTNREVPVLVDNGAGASVRTTRGGIVVRASDFNPERIILNDVVVGGATLPTTANVADSFPGATIGFIDYNFGNFKLQVASLPVAVSGGLLRETTAAPASDQLAVATFNVENLAPTDPPAKFATLAQLIVQNLQAPDALAIEEIQDDNGVTNNGNVDASTTWGMLISAVSAAGGPAYDYRQIDPVDAQDGGAPGGNIRQGFLFRTDRGLAFVDRAGAGSTTANSVVGSGAGTQLQYSPGRVDPTNTAFNASRKPLAAEFTFHGHHLFLIANHFNSKGGDDPLFGRFQPPTLSSEAQRHQQAQIVHDFVGAITTADPTAEVVVLGDINDFEFSVTVTTLEGSILHDLLGTLPQSERYTYEFEGNAQSLDHTLVSNSLFARPFQYDVVHVNSEFWDQASDHDPQVLRLGYSDWSGWTSHLGTWAAQGDGTFGDVLSSANGARYESASYFQPYGDATYEAQIVCTRPSEPTASNGIFFHGTPLPLGGGWWNQGYVFQISMSGKYSIFSMLGGVARVLQAWVAPVGTTIAGSGQANTLKVVTSGKTASFYLNGVLVKQLTGLGITSGKIGVGMVRSKPNPVSGDKMIVNYVSVTTGGLSHDRGDTVSAEQEAANAAANKGNPHIDPLFDLPGKHGNK